MSYLEEDNYRNASPSDRVTTPSHNLPIKNIMTQIGDPVATLAVL